jgi:hypothetical protein
MALALAELCQYVMVLATKRNDPLVTQLKADGYLITGRLEDIVYSDDGPVHKKVVYWPTYPEKTSTQERLRLLAADFRRALDYADRIGGWAIVMDETMFLHRTLKLEKELENVWFQGRTQGVSAIANAQRPAYVPRLAYSQATYLFIWQTGDKDDLERLRDISAGIPREQIEENVKMLDWESHEALFIDTRRPEFARVIATPR